MKNSHPKGSQWRGGLPHKPLLPCLYLSLLWWQTNHPNKSWPCGLRFSKPAVQMNVQINKRKVYLKNFQVQLNLSRFHMHYLSLRFMKESVFLNQGTCLEVWGQHFWPQESRAFGGTAGRGRQSSSDRRNSSEVKTNSRVAEGRWWSGKRGKSDNLALCCQMLNQVSFTPF